MVLLMGVYNDTSWTHPIDFTVKKSIMTVVAFTHYTVIRCIENNFGLSTVRKLCNNVLSDFR